MASSVDANHASLAAKTITATKSLMAREASPDPFQSLHAMRLSPNTLTCSYGKTMPQANSSTM